MTLEIKAFQKSDAKECYQLFYNTVHKINKKDYQIEQLRVWAKEAYDLERWEASFENKIALVTTQEDKIVGFIDATFEGYIDRLYVHHLYQNMGIAQNLLCEIEEILTTKYDIKKFGVHASLTAVDFFECAEYQRISANQVVRDNIILTNYYMEKEVF